MYTKDDVRIGTYFIIPLRTIREYPYTYTLKEQLKLFVDNGWLLNGWHYSDLYNSVNSLMLEKVTDEVSGKIGFNLYLPEYKIKEILKISTERKLSEIVFEVKPSEGGEKHEKYMFVFQSVQAVMMHSGIGFLIVGIESQDPATYYHLQNPGHNQNCSIIRTEDKSGPEVKISDFLSDLLGPVVLCEYSGETTDILRDAVTYSVALVREFTMPNNAADIREKIDQMCLNLRHGQALDLDSDYKSNDERHFSKYASVSTRDGRKFVRWGLYTIFRVTTQIKFCKEALGKFGSPSGVIKEPTRDTEGGNGTSSNDLDDVNREDNFLPFILLTLYVRYSYLLLSEYVRDLNPDSADRKLIDWLNEQIITLKAKGNFLPCDMTPYSNENSFLTAQMELYSTPNALALIDDKIAMINHIRDENVEKRKNAVGVLIAAFGLASIFCDTLGVFSYFQQESPTDSLCAVILLTEALLLAFGAIVVYFRTTLKDKGRKIIESTSKLVRKGISNANNNQNGSNH